MGYPGSGQVSGEFWAVGRLSRCRSRGVAWPNTRPCQGRERRFESGRDRHFEHLLLGEVAEWLKAAVSKTVMGHWPIESSNLSLSAPCPRFMSPAQERRNPDELEPLRQPSPGGFLFPHEHRPAGRRE